MSSYSTRVLAAPTPEREREESARHAVFEERVAALEEGSLAGVTLDVFPTEPLPAASPLWTHPKVMITPHNAAASDPRALVANILRQIERFEAGLPLEHALDRAVGY